MSYGMQGEWILLIGLHQLMKLLEARFHPRSKSGGAAVVVGHVRCEDDRIRIEPVEVEAEAIRPFDVRGLLAKLRFFVESAGDNPCDELVGMRSEYWSFVEVDAGFAPVGE